MNRVHSPMQEIDMIGKLADLKEQHYRNTLLISALMELLVNKKLITTEELDMTIIHLDAITMHEANHPKR